MPSELVDVEAWAGRLGSQVRHDEANADLLRQLRALLDEEEQP